MSLKEKWRWRPVPFRLAGNQDGKMGQNISILFKVMLPMVSFNYTNAFM
jgi:hypothetical protein